MNEKNQYTPTREIPEPIQKNLNRFKYVLAGMPFFYLVSLYIGGWSLEALVVFILLGAVVYYFYYQKKKICLKGEFTVIEGLIEEIEDNYLQEKIHEFIPVYKAKANGEGKKLLVQKLDGSYVRVHLGSKVKNSYQENTTVRIFAADVMKNASGMDEVYDYLAIVEIPVEELELKLNHEMEIEEARKQLVATIMQEKEEHLNLLDEMLASL